MSVHNRPATRSQSALPFAGSLVRALVLLLALVPSAALLPDSAYGADQAKADASSQTASSDASDAAQGDDAQADDQAGDDTGTLRIEDGRVSCDMYTVELPKNWDVLRTTDLGSATVVVFTTKNRDAEATVVAGESGGSPLSTIARCFAQQYGADGKASIKNNVATFSFTDSGDGDSQAWVTTQDNVYLVITLSGNLRKAKSFIRTFESSRYSKLLPKL